VTPRKIVKVAPNQNHTHEIGTARNVKKQITSVVSRSSANRMYRRKKRDFLTALLKIKPHNSATTAEIPALWMMNTKGTAYAMASPVKKVYRTPLDT